MYNAAVRFLASKRAHRGAFAAYTPGHTSVSAPAEAAASGLCREVPSFPIACARAHANSERAPEHGAGIIARRQTSELAHFLFGIRHARSSQNKTRRCT